MLFRFRRVRTFVLGLAGWEMSFLVFGRDLGSWAFVRLFCWCGLCGFIELDGMRIRGAMEKEEEWREGWMKDRECLRKCWFVIGR